MLELLSTQPQHQRPSRTDSADRVHLRERMQKPQRHRLLHGYPLAAAMQARPASLDLDVQPDEDRGRLGYGHH